jgi:hypothetical protein
MKSYIKAGGSSKIGQYIKAFASVPAYDPDAQAFFTASGLTGATELNAVNQLVLDMKSYGIWTKMKAIYPFVGGTAALHKWNLKDPQDTNAAFRLVFNGGWTHSSNGALPNGTNAFADSFLSTSAISLNSVHISYYSRTNNTSIGCEIGGGNSSPDSYTLLQGRTHVAPVTDTAIWVNNTAGVDRVAGVNTAAFFCGSRTGANIIRLFRNSVRIINGTKSSNTTSIFPIWLGAFNFAGIGAVYSNRECAFSSIGDGLTDTEAADFYTAVQNFNTTLTRNV